ncbi:hypothetical protein HPP92_010574 [Vanilla planifolia]|uniref:Photosystem II core complex proteins psbY, chloroplastic n=1 Tax=Vanilla planifolia TaxID=51239 RepID=A0A835R6R3_VANPL|nr:hypothetical protein HPP92_010574 [Vanilla planifolia]
MATTAISAAAMFVAKCATTPPKPTANSASLCLKSLPKIPNSSVPSFPPLKSSAIIAAGVFSALSSADSAFALQHIADIAEGDSRGLALLIPIVPAIAWVLFNILQPALNQINRMRSAKGIVIGFGLGLGVASVTSASAGEVASLAEAASGDNRGLLLLGPVGGAVAWVLFNILQPALNQINRMRSR